MQVPEFTVVDFNAGFGGRSLAFRDCGFSVVAAAESDPVKQEILRGIVPDIPIFTEPISLENLSSLPGTDILMADIPAESLARQRVDQKKGDVDSYLHLFSEFILCNQPKAFLIQIPSSAVEIKQCTAVKFEVPAISSPSELATLRLLLIIKSEILTVSQFSILNDQ